MNARAEAEEGKVKAKASKRGSKAQGGKKQMPASQGSRASQRQRSAARKPVSYSDDMDQEEEEDAMDIDDAEYGDDLAHRLVMSHLLLAAPLCCGKGNMCGKTHKVKGAFRQTDHESWHAGMRPRVLAGATGTQTSRSCSSACAACFRYQQKLNFTRLCASGLHMRVW